MDRFINGLAVKHFLVFRTKISWKREGEYPNICVRKKFMINGIGRSQICAFATGRNPRIGYRNPAGCIGGPGKITKNVCIAHRQILQFLSVYRVRNAAPLHNLM